MSFNWKLEKKNTIYNRIKCVEYCDIQHLNGFLNTNMGVVYHVRDQKRIKYESERNQLAHYW